MTDPIATPPQPQITHQASTGGIIIFFLVIAALCVIDNIAWLWRTDPAHPERFNVNCAIVRIDGCQYLVTPQGDIYHFHACDNPIHHPKP